MRKYLLFCLAFCVLGCLAQDLIVRPNDPIIYKKEGGAFLWLGDTAWELFHVLDKEEIVHYLDNRQKKGFTVIQAVILSELDGLANAVWIPYGCCHLLPSNLQWCSATS